MNEKINLQDLSALLAEKAAITKKEAETFIREYFEVMSEELIKSGLLKIKDLGTFKLLLMEDRESIDVTTGERVLIPAHYKVAFVPDKKLAETVNEPFAFFETIEMEEDMELEESNTFPEDDMEEFELSPEDNDKIALEDSITEEKVEIIREEAVFEEKTTQYEAVQEKMLQEETEKLSVNEHVDESEKPDSEDNSSVSYSDFKRYCLSCIDREAHQIYKEKYLKAKTKLRQLRLTIYILIALLAGALGYIAYLGYMGIIYP